MEYPLVSIIVVSYNHAKFIKENLDSIKAQTYPNIELIVADDASKDNSTEVFEQWLSENNYPAKKNFHNKNTGLATMLNECIKLCSGEYIKMIAADDFLHNNYIDECIGKLFQDSSEIIFTQATSIDSNSKIIIQNHFPIPQFDAQTIKFELANGNFISGATLLFKKSVINDIGLFRKHILLEDYDFVLRAINNKKIISYIPKNLIFYRQHTTNITKLKNIDLEAETAILKLTYIKENSFKKIINSSILSHVILYGKKYSKKVLINYIKYPHKSLKVIYHLAKTILR